VASAPRLVDGTAFLGEYRDSGYKEPPLMVRRGDGKMVQLPALLYAVASEIDGTRQFEEIAERASANVGRGLAPDDVRYLLDEKLAPLGIAWPSDGSTPPEAALAADPLLALRLRTKVIPDGLVRAVTTIFKPFFFPVLVILLVGGVLVLDWWLFFEHGVAQGARSILETPILMLLVFSLVVITAAFHEIGHATGCRYGGADPGGMGVGLYIVWPAFYTDISESHSLGRGGRLRADLGGVYFNGILSLITAGVAVATGVQALWILVLLQQFEVVRQMLPLLRLDGYYVVSDLVGVPDLFGRIKPILLSFLPGRSPDGRVTELKPWVRVVVTAWVVAVVAFLAYYTTLLVLSLPRLVATGWDSFNAQRASAASALADGRVAEGAFAVIQMLILAAPVAGITYMLVMAAKRWWKGWQALADRPAARTAMFAATAILVAGLAFMWWPADQYRPIGPQERWTVGDTLVAAGNTVAGRRSALGQVSDPAVEAGQNAGTVPEGGSSGSSIGPATTPSPGVSSSPATSPSPTVSPSASVTPSPSPSPTPSATLSPTPTPSPTP
jgi:putative peptide zinc metalloprotease protein